MTGGEDWLRVSADEPKRHLRPKEVVFNPRFKGPPSPYMGAPSEELDERWHKIQRGG